MYSDFSYYNNDHSGTMSYKHICLLYKTLEEWWASTAPFLANKLKRGEKCTYIANEHSASQIRRSLNEEMVNTDALESSGQLMIRQAGEFFSSGGLINPDRTVALLVDERRKAITEGYPALTILTEMTWVLSGREGADKLPEYEAKLNRDFPPYYPCSIICLYNRDSFEPATIKDVIMTHPVLINGNRIYKNNYYMPCWKFLDEKRSMHEVNLMLDNLEHERVVRERLLFFAEALEYSSQPFVARYHGGHIIACNPAFCNLTGYTEKELCEMPLKAGITPSDWFKNEANVLKEMRRTGQPQLFEKEYFHKDGHRISVELLLHQSLDSEGLFYYAFVTDITERKRAQEQLVESEKRYRQIVETSGDGVWIIDADNRTSFANERFVRMTGYPIGELIGKQALEFFDEKYHSVIAANLRSIQRGKNIRKDTKFRRKDGGVLWSIVSSTAIFDKSGAYAGALGMITDITERKRMEKELEYISLHDPLTGLYNRTFFEKEMLRAGVETQKHAGIIVCDLDCLKFINDTLGHDVGDALIVEAAGVFKASFRDSDLIARIGGDEFAVLIPYGNEETIVKACERVRGTVARYNATRPELPLSLSIGFAVSKGLPVSMSELFKEADNNMYREKLCHSQSARCAIVQTLLKALDVRDFISGGHADRLKELVTFLAGPIPLPESKVAEMHLLAQFHDIGKVGVPKSILLKPGALTSDEYAEIQRHCEIGHRIATSVPDLVHIADWILKHHEWWNGKGYPLGLKGDEIPLECRILTIIDAYDAMTSERPYREVMTPEAAVRELEKCSGIQFDPHLLAVFISELRRTGKVRMADNCKS